MLEAVIVAQISDMHVKRRGHVLHHMPHVAQPLYRALSAIATLPQQPECIVATGDLAAGEPPAEAAAILAEDMAPRAAG